MKSGIYLFTINGRSYVGSAVDIKARRSTHLHNLRKGKHGNRFFQSCYNKHGEENLKHEVLEYVEKERLIEREQFYIDTMNPCINIAKKAGNTLGVKQTEEVRKRNSQLRMGHKWGVGRVQSAETRKKISDKAKERGLHPKFLEASKRANTGIKHSKEFRDRLAKAQSKVSVEQSKQIKEMSKNGVYQKDIASIFGISQRLVVRVLQGIGIYGTEDYA